MAHPVQLNSDVTNYYASLPQSPDDIFAEYIWIDGELNLRSKTRCGKTTDDSRDFRHYPVWSFDGSSIGQATGKDSEVMLKPVAVYNDPFRKSPHVLVLCETCMPDEKLTPHPSNTRREYMNILDKVKASEPWFAIEQEYTLFHGGSILPLAWDKEGKTDPFPQGPYYCGIGTNKAIGRSVAESHLRACLYAGINMAGINAEVMPGQWEYQVGICMGDQIDDVWMARYILERVAEDFGVGISFDPKPRQGNWNGAGAHTNFSTKEMRKERGYTAILDAVAKLEKTHSQDIPFYGKGNELRLTGAHETAPIDKFSWGVANRGASVRIPRQVFIDQKGYLEDRRPAANCDPYVVCGRILRSVILDK